MAPKSSLSDIRARNERGQFVSPPRKETRRLEPPPEMRAKLGLNERGQIVPAPLAKKPPARATSRQAPPAKTGRKH